MRKKLWLWAAILCMAVLILPCQVMAHSGRTDANGGHRDNQNKSGLGSYHYHCGGHPAHLHPDGVCPYSSSAATSGQTQPKEKDTIKIHNAPAELKVGDSHQLEYTITFTDQEQVTIGSSAPAGCHSTAWMAVLPSAEGKVNSFRFSIAQGSFVWYNPKNG